MTLTGIQIYKLLPKTNCKDCGFPTCLAFAMKLAAKQVELSLCPHVSEEAKTQLAESAAPPIRLVTLKSNGFEAKAGNEVVLFRHEKTFYYKPGLFVRVRDSEPVEAIQAKVSQADAFKVNYVGIDLVLDGFAVASVSGDPAAFAGAVGAVRQASHRPLILMTRSAEIAAAGLRAIDGETPLLYGADVQNWEAMADLGLQDRAIAISPERSICSLSKVVQTPATVTLSTTAGVTPACSSTGMAASASMRSRVMSISLPNLLW